jgi:hypothetical protein
MKKRLNASPGLCGVFTHDWLLRRSELGPGAKLLYSALARRSDDRGTAREHLRVLAREVGVGEADVARHLVELEECGLLRLKSHGEVPALYSFTFLTHPWMGGAEGDAGAVGGAGRRRPPRVPRSRFPREVCQRFAEHLISKGRKIRNIQGFTTYLYLDGEQDERIAGFLEKGRDAGGAGDGACEAKSGGGSESGPTMAEGSVGEKAAA